MRFDHVRIFPCLVPSPCSGSGGGSAGGDNGGGDGVGCSDPDYRTSHLNECPDDLRCSDESFALANPSLCLNTPRLIIKPNLTRSEVGASVEFKAFLVVNGSETELTAGIRFFSQDTTIIVVGSTTGHATCLAVGIATIAVEYGLLQAAARVEVIASGACAARQNFFEIALDTSRSSSSAFSSAYTSRLSLAKYLISGFCDTLDPKDFVGLLTFNTGSTVAASFTSDSYIVKSSAQASSSTNARTSIASALRGAVAAFDASGVPADSRVIVLFSDGENNVGDDPVAIAQDIRNTGATIIVFGLRASLSAFRLLDAVATGGFFVNVLPSNQSSALAWLTGLRSYICSGNCIPDGDVNVGVPQLNYATLQKWVVTRGHVDLIGGNEGGPARFNFLPGNGLVIDLCGSVPGAADMATIETEAPIIFLRRPYTLHVQLAGNQREAGIDTVTISAVGADGTTIGTRAISIAHDADFSDYTLEFTPNAAQAGGAGGKLVIAQTAIRPGGTGVMGNLLNSVWLEVDGVAVFTDNFDYENPQYIAPCGGYGYGCDQGCLTSPIEAQVPDPSPLPDNETDRPTPTLFTSQKTCTVTCESGTGSATATAGAISDISQIDADTRATEAACASARSGLVCTCAPGVGDIISVNLKYNLSDPVKRGFAAVGLSAEDFWNEPPATGGLVGFTLLNTLGCKTGIALTAGDSYASLPATEAFPDVLMRSGVAGIETGVFRLRLDSVPAGKYDFYLYGHGAANNQSTEFKVEVGSFTPQNVPVSVTHYGPVSTVNGAGWDNVAWEDRVQFARVTLLVNDGDKVLITAGLGADGGARFNGFQMKRVSVDSVDYNIVFSSNGTDPYPSDKYVYGTPGLITNVTVGLIDFAHDAPAELDIILEHPDGTHVLLMSGSSAAEGQLAALSFNDAYPPLPETSGTYVDAQTWAPAQYGSPANPLAPAPQPPHETTLTSLNGKGPNGRWRLWIYDRTSGNPDGFVYQWTLGIS